LQSGSDRMLRRMGRHWYTASTYRQRCEALAARLPAFGLGADVIVGFPGESEADHLASLALIRALPFTYLHVFPYSERPTASARRLGDPVSPATVTRRSRELRQLAAARGASYRRRRAGRSADVVLLGRRQRRFRGLTEDYVEVYLPSDRTGRPPPRFTTTLALDEDGSLTAVMPSSAADFGEGDGTHGW
ncbi:MAG: hypothetical protein ACE5E6_09005, partial [Phycisphaerae bacterium]